MQSRLLCCELSSQRRTPKRVELRRLSLGVGSREFGSDVDSWELEVGSWRLTRILLLSTTTGYQLRSFGESAARLGIELTLATDRCNHLEDPWRDGAIPVRFYDEDGSLRGHSRRRLRNGRFAGVIAVGDRPAVLAARVAAALDLPGNPPAAAEATRNKRLMRQKFAEAGLAVPWFVELPAGAAVESILGAVRYPCVIKPLGLSGSRGVIRADNPGQLGYGVQRVRALLARPEIRAQRSGLDDRLLVEGFIDGEEYAVEALMTAGRTARTGNLRQARSPRWPVLRGNDLRDADRGISATCSVRLPRNCSEARRRSALCTVRFTPSAASSRRGVVMLEIAARPIGGLCSKVLRFSAGGRNRAARRSPPAALPRGGHQRVPARTGGIRGDDDPDSEAGHSQEGREASRRRGKSRTSTTSGSLRSPINCWNRCPRETAISGSSSRGHARPSK